MIEPRLDWWKKTAPELVVEHVSGGYTRQKLPNVGHLRPSLTKYWAKSWLQEQLFEKHVGSSWATLELAGFAGGRSPGRAVRSSSATFGWLSPPCRHRPLQGFGIARRCSPRKLVASRQCYRPLGAAGNSALPSPQGQRGVAEMSHEPYALAGCDAAPWHRESRR